MKNEKITLCWKAFSAFLFMVVAICLSMVTSFTKEDEVIERENTVALPALICTDKILRTDTVYLLVGSIFVTNGATLTTGGISA